MTDHKNPDLMINHPSSEVWGRLLYDLQRTASVQPRFPATDFGERKLADESLRQAYETLIEAVEKTLDDYFEDVAMEYDGGGESTSDLVTFDPSGWRDADGDGSVTVWLAPGFVNVSITDPQTYYYWWDLDSFDAFEFGQRSLLRKIALLSDEYDLSITELVDYFGVDLDANQLEGVPSEQTWADARGRHRETIREHARTVEETLFNAGEGSPLSPEESAELLAYLRGESDSDSLTLDEAGVVISRKQNSAGRYYIRGETEAVEELRDVFVTQYARVTSKSPDRVSVDELPEDIVGEDVSALVID